MKKATAKMDRTTEAFQGTFEASLNGIDPKTLTDKEREEWVEWVEENWDDLNLNTVTYGKLYL